MRLVQVYDITEAQHTWAGEWMEFSSFLQAASADWKKAAPDFQVAVKTQRVHVRRLCKRVVDGKGELVAVDEKFIAVSPRLYELLMAYVDEEIREKLEALHSYNEAQAALLKQSQAMYEGASSLRAAYKDRIDRFINAPWYKRVWHAITLKELP